NLKNIQGVATLCGPNLLIFANNHYGSSFLPFHDNSSPLDVSKDQIEDFFEYNNEVSSIDDDSFSIDNIDYAEASPPDSELISSGSTTTHSDNSLPEYEVFHNDHVKEISSGSSTTHSDSSLYASFLFDLLINPFPPADRSDFYEFADELIPFISPQSMIVSSSRLNPTREISPRMWWRIFL
nr:hypothetical protein [Tanacetum cinerariifolium]